MKFLKFLVGLWQKIPKHPHCRFYPSCSNYFLLAVQKYGFLKGTLKGILRILKCNPFFKGGIDFP
ncbi:MAG: membrane protein insertion efficiency factor YidD [Elusimicrobia bacterium]|nr:membrane protein insertion efficiency factor YidD [Elusimicrobiota bacterium]